MPPKFMASSFKFEEGERVPDHIESYPDIKKSDPSKFCLEGEDTFDGEYYPLATDIDDFSTARILQIARLKLRVLLVDKKPLYISCDEITYSVISGVTYSGVGLGGGTVTLHTRIGDINIRTFNRRAADFFTKSIEASIFQHTGIKNLHN